MIRHECGLLGIYGHEEAARLTYFGLYAQQHRGQESAGIVTIDEKGLLHEHKGMGLVPDVFAEANLQALPGTISLGHVRYSTTGRSAARNAQPFVAHYKGLDIAIAHNGNLVNTMELREELENDGAIFSTTNDTEVFMHLIVRALREHDLVDAIREACARVRGAYCLLVYAGGTMVAVRDPHGFHPLALGRLDGAPVLASETCAFDLLEADYERPIQPGEMLIMDGKGEHSEQLRGPLPERPRQCIFELVYFARPDSFVFGEQVYQCRKQMGWQLAHESTPDVDFIMPFPDSGVYSAVGFAQCAELPYEHAMIRNHYVGRTFIQPTQSMRNFGVRVKINPVRSMIEGKKICIVDDSIVRGTTMITIIPCPAASRANSVWNAAAAAAAVSPRFFTWLLSLIVSRASRTCIRRRARCSPAWRIPRARSSAVTASWSCAPPCWNTPTCSSAPSAKRPTWCRKRCSPSRTARAA